MSAAVRSGIGQFHYTTAEAAHIVFNPTASANGLRDGHITIDPEQRTLSGWIMGGGFCHVKTNDYVIYYTVVFDTPFKDCGIWQGAEKQPGATEAKGDNIAAYISFDGTTPRTITLKTAISYVSLANSQENLKTEIPGWDFQASSDRCQGRLE